MVYLLSLKTELYTTKPGKIQTKASKSRSEDFHLGDSYAVKLTSPGLNLTLCKITYFTYVQ